MYRRYVSFSKTRNSNDHFIYCWWAFKSYLHNRSWSLNKNVFTSALQLGTLCLSNVVWSNGRLLLGLSAELGTCFVKKQRLFIVSKGEASIEPCVRFIFIRFISSNLGARTHTGIAHKTTRQHKVSDITEQAPLCFLSWLYRQLRVKSNLGRLEKTRFVWRRVEIRLCWETTEEVQPH